MLEYAEGYSDDWRKDCGRLRLLYCNLRSLKPGARQCYSCTFVIGIRANTYFVVRRVGWTARSITLSAKTGEDALSIISNGRCYSAGSGLSTAVDVDDGSRSG